MAKLTNVSCNYTGGGVYVYTAKYNDEVWLVTDFMTCDSYGCYDAPLDVVEEDLTADGHINYDGHWKMPSVPLPRWADILNSIRISDDAWAFSDVQKKLNSIGANLLSRIDEKKPSDNSERLEILCAFIEVFEDFLDEKGVVIPNDEKEQSPDSACNIYGTDYGILSDRIEHLLIRLGYMKEEK